MSDNRDYKKEFKELAKDNIVLNTQNAILKYENDNLKEQLNLGGVMFELPSTKEIKDRIKHVIENSFEDNETIEKREYTLGFNACFNWLKIKQMKTKGN